jgi:hypothetical protein
MGRRKTNREHQGINNSEVFLAKHNLQIWSSERIGCWQWETIRLLHLQRILQVLGHSCEILISVSSVVQRSSWKDKWANILRNQEVLIWSQEGRMGWWIAESNLVPQHHCVKSNRFHAFSLTLRHWSNDTRGNQEWKHESAESKRNRRGWPKK